MSEENKTISIETEKLLDKLFNLRGPDSVILKDLESMELMETEIVEQMLYAESELTAKISELETKLDTYKTQGDLWANYLTGIKTEDVGEVLKAIDSKFDIESENEKLNVTLKQIVEDLTAEIKTAKDELKEVRAKMHAAESKIKEVHDQKEYAINQQATLNTYIERSLSGDLTLTREELEPFLASFKFMDKSSYLDEEGVVA